jgi:RNA ligase partner protein
MNYRIFILDTSVFTNPDVYIQFGEDSDQAVENFFQIAYQLKNCAFFMPPSVYKEISHFLSQETMSRLFTIVEQKSPKKYEMKVPAFLLYEIIQDVRNRIDKGLRVVETILRSPEKGEVEHQVSELRKKYRKALREGIVDSTEDLEIILLGMEMEATVVSADEGIMKLADKLGIRYLESRTLREILLLILQKEDRKQGS